VGKLFDSIDDKLARWMNRQRLFFVGTAPSGPEGHVNVSPKGGIETFRIVDPHTVAYLDLVGSGVETISHLRENGRIVVMFCAFEGPPRIVRLHGRGEVVQLGEPGFDERARELGLDQIALAEDAARSIVTVAVERVADSCGYGVPLMRYEGPRTQQSAWVENRLRKHGPGAIVDYIAEHNEASIDSLPGVELELLPDHSL
jgi:hypothetical protein